MRNLKIALLLSAFIFVSNVSAQYAFIKDDETYVMLAAAGTFNGTFFTPGLGIKLHYPNKIVYPSISAGYYFPVSLDNDVTAYKFSNLNFYLFKPFWKKEMSRWVASGGYFLSNYDRPGILTEEDGFAFSLGWQRKWGFYMPLYATPAVNVVQGWSETTVGASLKVETNKDFYSAYGIISLTSTDYPLAIGIGGTLYIY